jgi:hypothetical protein
VVTPLLVMEGVGKERFREAILSEKDGEGDSIFYFNILFFDSLSLFHVSLFFFHFFFQFFQFNFFLFLFTQHKSTVFDLSFIFPKTYFSPPGVITFDDHNEVLQSHRVEGIEDVWIFQKFFSANECKQLIELTDSMGYLETDKVGSAVRTGRPPASKACWLMPLEQCQSFFERLKPLLPNQYGDRHITGINPRFRFYKYHPGYMLGMHQDVGMYPLSYVDEDGELRYNYSQDTQMSLMSLLIYLNEDFVGGCTSFFNLDEDQNVVNKIPIVPKCGDAVVFWHGDHPLSPYHEGSLVENGVKYIIRTDILFS